MFKKTIKRTLAIVVLASSSMLAGCEANVGVGLNVGIPIGDHGYMSVGTDRWF